MHVYVYTWFHVLAHVCEYIWRAEADKRCLSLLFPIYSWGMVSSNSTNLARQLVCVSNAETALDRTKSSDCGCQLGGQDRGLSCSAASNQCEYEDTPHKALRPLGELSWERAVYIQTGKSIYCWYYIWEFSQVTGHGIECWEVLASGPETSTPKINVLAPPNNHQSTIWRVQTISHNKAQEHIQEIKKPWVIAKSAWPCIQLRINRHSRKCWKILCLIGPIIQFSERPWLKATRQGAMEGTMGGDT